MQKQIFEASDTYKEKFLPSTLRWTCDLNVLEAHDQWCVYRTTFQSASIHKQIERKITQIHIP